MSHVACTSCPVQFLLGRGRRRRRRRRRRRPRRRVWGEEAEAGGLEEGQVQGHGLGRGVRRGDRAEGPAQPQNYLTIQGWIETCGPAHLSCELNWEFETDRQRYTTLLCDSIYNEVSWWRDARFTRGPFVSNQTSYILPGVDIEEVLDIQVWIICHDNN